MVDNILKSEATEHLSNRQTAKILYLQQELSQSQEHIKDLQYMLKLNKEALILMSSTDNNKTNESINRFYEENLRLLERVGSLIKERNISQSKALINRQIAEESENRQTEIEQEMEEKTNELRRIIQDKEYTIQELEKIKPITQKDGSIIKYREILNPNEQLVKIQQENMNFLNNMSKLSKKLNLAEEENKQLKERNNTLKRELYKIKFALINQTNHFRLKNNYCLSNLDHLEFSDSECSLIMPDYKTFKLDFKKKNDLNLVIPPHDIKKNTNFQLQYSLKIESLESEIKRLKEILQSESSNNHLLLNELKILNINQEKILITNESLIKSNKILESKLNRLRINLEFYKDFFYEYLIYFKERSKKDKSNIIDESNEFKNTNKLIKNKEINISILEEENEKNLPRKKTDTINFTNKLSLILKEKDEPEIPDDFHISKAKTFLLNLAKELYSDTNMRAFYSMNRNILKNYDFDPKKIKYVIKPKRSMSNPLEYISKNLRDNLHRTVLDRKLKRISLKNKRKNSKSAKLISPIRTIHENHEKWDIKLPFTLDVSKIVPDNIENSFDENF